MSATTSGAVKAYLESLGVPGLSVYRDRAPQDATLPLANVQERIALTLDQDGDLMDPDADRGCLEQCQVAVFQAWRDADGRNAESYTLVPQIVRALHGSQLLTTGPNLPNARVWGVRVRGVTRIPQIDGPGSTGDSADRANIVQDVITLDVRRDL